MVKVIIAFRGDVVERQELLNGTESVTVEGASEDGMWRVVATVSWNLGLVDMSGEGDFEIAGDGGEVYGTLVDAKAEAGAGEERAEWAVHARFDVDGGAGRFESAAGTAAMRMQLRGTEAEGEAELNLEVT